MTAIDSAPSNKNFLSPLNFRFRIKKAPSINFFIQKVSIPRIYLPDVAQVNPFVTIKRPGDHIDFGDLNISFKVDEDLQNYMELYNWIVQMGKPENFSQYASIASKPQYTGEGIYSDVELDILSSKRRPNYAIVFQDAFPTDIGDVTFDTTLEDVQFITAEATFKYRSYTIEKIL